MNIKFKTDEYNCKTFNFGRYEFHVYPYGRGEWTISLYEYGHKRINDNCTQVGYHFQLELSYRPVSIREARNLITEFLTNKTI